MLTYEDGAVRAAILTDAHRMHMAFDPDGLEVWCDFADAPAMTNDGHCQYCGRRDHDTCGG